MRVIMTTLVAATAAAAVVAVFLCCDQSQRMRLPPSLKEKGSLRLHGLKTFQQALTTFSCGVKNPTSLFLEDRENARTNTIYIFRRTFQGYTITLVLLL